jgi:HlyD family type I secretion membrane fusion protein
MHRTFITKFIDLKGYTKVAKRLYADMKSFMYGATPEESKYILQYSEDLKKQIMSPIKFAFGVIAFAVGFFVLWGAFAPLDSAAIARGVITLSGNRKTIQHLEGGVIDRILVKDGEEVAEGQELIVLNDTAAKARLQMVLSQLRSAKAMEKRLLAEKIEAPKVVFDDELLDREIPEVAKILDTQEAIYETRMKSMQGKRNVLAQKIVEHKEQIKGLESVLESLESQNVIVSEQLKNLESLFNKGYAKKTDYLEYKRRGQELKGKLGEIKANIAGANETVAETQLQIMNLENENQKEINAELKETHSHILDLQEQYQAANDILKRTVIRAPKAGVITDLQYHTVGGVITPGSKIMDIVPQDDQLIVEAHIMPQDIESVYVGLKAKVQLSAYKSRLVPRIDGEVTYVAADRMDEKNGQPPYYIAKIMIKPESINKINYDIKLHPGMPAEVFIVKGERTFLQYLASPIIDSFHKAFKEK